LYNVASCWLYLKEYFNDARYHERQIHSASLQAHENADGVLKDFLQKGGDLSLTLINLLWLDKRK
jgi:hypothetical protein